VEPAAAIPERCLSLLVEGTAINVPEIDAESYKEFRTNVGKLTQQLADRLADDDKLPLIRSILHEYENYRKSADDELRQRLAGWRAATATLFSELLGCLGIDAASSTAAPLVKKIQSLVSSGEIQEFRDQLTGFLHPAGSDGPAAKVSPLKAADHSTENLNAAGLRGGGKAVEHLKEIMERGGKGFIVLFRLSCLNVVSQRFGAEAVEDCLMAVSAFLTANLRSDDVIYHWSDSTLLAILQGRPDEKVLSAELQRIAAQNRDTAVTIGGRPIMLRIPLNFELTPIEKLSAADDLYKISRERAA